MTQFQFSSSLPACSRTGNLIAWHLRFDHEVERRAR